MEKANAVSEVYNAVLARPLEIEEMDEFYCDTDQVRGVLSARKQLKLKIEQNAVSGKNGHFLFVGYRGCGKSTELNHLQKDLQNDYAILNYSIMEELDPQNIEYIELFIVTMERLFNLAVEQHLQIDQDFLKKIVNWTSTREIQDIKDRHFSVEAETGIEAKAELPYLLKFFFKLKGAAKASKSFKDTIKQTIEPRLSDLIQHCNELISVVRQQMFESKGKKDLVIFIEDLDKIPLHVAERLFYNYATQLIQLKATVVYTFPVTLYYNIRFGTIGGYFQTIELPMVKTANKDGSEYTAGINALKAIVNTRINHALFSNDIVLQQFVEKSGGVIRDIFTMLDDAATSAMLNGSAMIRDEDFTYAYNQLKKEYNNTIADYKEGEVEHTAKDFYETMAELVRSGNKKPDNSAIMMLLRQTLCVLSYNGEGWCDVHPIMKDILAERGYALN